MRAFRLDRFPAAQPAHWEALLSQCIVLCKPYEPDLVPQPCSTRAPVLSAPTLSFVAPAGTVSTAVGNSLAASATPSLFRTAASATATGTPAADALRAAIAADEAARAEEEAARFAGLPPGLTHPLCDAIQVGSRREGND